MAPVTDTSSSAFKELSAVESLRLLTESIKDHAIFMLDTAGCVASWNAGAELITGYTAAEIIGRHFSRFYTVEDIQCEYPAGELQLAADKGRCESEGWRVRKDGSRFIAQSTTGLIRDEDGKLRGFSQILHDVTGRRRRESVWHESQEQFRHFFDDAGPGGAIITPAGNFLKANRALCKMTGYPEAELLAGNFQKITHPDDLADHRAFFNEMITGRRETGRLEKRYHHKTGRLIYLGWHVSFVREPDGTPRYLFAYIEDITERKLREVEREQFIGELQKTLARVKTLSGVVPICGWCKNVRSPQGYWQTVEDYIHSQTAVTFNHGICPECQKKFREQIERPETNPLQLPLV